MKNSIKLIALFLLASTGLFAAVPSKGKGAVIASEKNIVTFSSLPSHKGVDIQLDRASAGKAVVIVYDQDKNVIFKDVLPAYKVMDKGYVLNQLENGDYTIEVTSNNQVVKKDIHVYDEYRTRVFLVKE